MTVNNTVQLTAVTNDGNACLMLCFHLTKKQIKQLTSHEAKGLDSKTEDAHNAVHSFVLPTNSAAACNRKSPTNKITASRLIGPST